MKIMIKARSSGFKDMFPPEGLVGLLELDKGKIEHYLGLITEVDDLKKLNPRVSHITEVTDIKYGFPEMRKVDDCEDLTDAEKAAENSVIYKKMGFESVLIVDEFPEDTLFDKIDNPSYLVADSQGIYWTGSSGQDVGDYKTESIQKSTLEESLREIKD